MLDKPIKRKPVILCIMDGFGMRKENYGNAINQAKKPHLDDFFASFPFTEIDASGLAVGLPEGQMGNSEVGHMNMGAGRVVYQSLTLITKCIKDGTFFNNEHYLHAINNAKANNKKLHVFALMSDGGVHSHIEHVLAMIDMCKLHGIGRDQLCIHGFLDGRDVSPTSSSKYLDMVEAECKKEDIGHICSLHGRYYVMDRDKNMDRVDVSYRTLVLREGNSFEDFHEYLNAQYESLVKEGKSASDEFIFPAYNSKYDGTIEDGDSIIFMNFRPDRAIQISTFITNI